MNGLDNLNDVQRNLLRLVGENKSTKEIAIEIGLSHHTVDTYLKRSIATLGVSNRREAARLIVESEQSQKLGYQPERIEPPAELPQPEVTPSHGVRRSRWKQILDLPPIGGRVDDRSVGQKLVAIVKISVITTLGVLVIILLYHWVSKIPHF